MNKPTTLVDKVFANHADTPFEQEWKCAKDMYKLARKLETDRARLIEALRPLLNLSKHPLFHEQTELPAWGDKVEQARSLIRELEGK